MKDPEGISLECSLSGNELQCKTDRNIDNKAIAIEQTIIKEGIEEVLILGSINTIEKINCSNAIYQESSKRKEINISFRQVSHLEKNDNGFSFYLISLMTKEYKKGSRINLKMNVLINKILTEKNAVCILEKDVSPANGAQSQGIFVCSVSLTSAEVPKTDFESISVSSDNDEISGVSDLNEITSNPSKTDKAIQETKNKKAKNEDVNELSNVVDYYSEEAEIKIPPTLNVDAININDCNINGKLTLAGTFSDDIDEEMKFDLPLTYPNVEIKCEFDEAKKNNKMDIICKVQTAFDLVENFIIEPRLIKKKNQEMFFIQGKELPLKGKQSCKNYNEIKMQKAKVIQTSKYSFLQLGKLELIANKIQFFLALIRMTKDVPFQPRHILPVKLKLSSRRLRNLEQTLYGVEVTCDLNKELETDLAAGYDCINSNIKGTPISVVLQKDDIENISGIPDNANPAKLKSNIDYSNINNLKIINNMPNVNISSINGDTCSKDGQYYIYGTLNDKGELESQYSNVELRFLAPESSGLCEVLIENTNLTMICQNKEKFSISQILIDRQAVQDSEGNEIFIINSYTSLEQFACDISLNSVNATKIPTNGTEGVGHQMMTKTKKKGLNGGAIAGIVIASVAIVAIVAGLIILGKKGVLFSGKGNNKSVNNETTIEQFDTNDKINKI